MDRLDELNKRWLASRSLSHYLEYLAEKVWVGEATYVFLDPDGTIRWPSLAVIVFAETGVVYGTQCGGTATTGRWAEGYLVPVGGARFDTERDSGRGWDDTAAFTRVFHGPRDRCPFQASGHELSESALRSLTELVSDIAFWVTPGPQSSEDERLNLRVDVDRLDELVEAWVPVVTPRGPGVLIWDNCD